MITLTDVIKRKFMHVAFWQATTAIAIIGGFVAVQMTVAQMMHPIRFVMLNSRETMYLTSGGTFETIEKIHLDYAKMAAETMFDRSPDGGLDNEERADRLFNTRTRQQLKDDVARDAEVFKKQQLHQKWECGQVREVALDNNSAALELKGQLIRTGFLHQRVVSTTPVTLYVKLVSNDEIEENRKFPLVVFSYESRF